jgi:divalent metal cation (Fe/Co/Zn/Cd) transporter
MGLRGVIRSGMIFIPYLAGVASLLVGCLLTFASAVLARESRSLLIGEGISEKTGREIRDLVEDVSDGAEVKRVYSNYRGPDEVLLVLIVGFPSGLETDEITARIGRIREKIKERYPKIAHIMIQPE